MTRYVLVDAVNKTVKHHEAESITECYPLVGLKAAELDHGTVFRDETGCGIALFVYEYGLVEPPATQLFFSIERELYAGNGAVLFAFDERGETINMPDTLPPVMFYQNAKAVERAIQRGEVPRPRMAVNGITTWEWHA